MRLPYMLTGVAAALLVGACGSAAPSPTAVATSPSPTPDIRATVEAEVQARLRSRETITPTPVPLAPAGREAIATFASSHSEIIRDWEEFHVSIDEWRRGLTACAPSSVEVVLRQFAATIGAVAAQAAGLPRSSDVRAIADKLVAATEGEATAVRQLRDGWQPDGTELFENVDAERSAAQAFLREVQDALGDLQVRTAPATRASLGTFASAVAELSVTWDSFRQSYDSFRAQEVTQTSAETVADLSRLIDELRRMVIDVRDLPVVDGAGEVSMMFADAVEAEDLALRRLRGTFQRATVAPGPSDELPPEEGLESGASEGPAETGTEITFSAQDPTLFDAFDAQLAQSNASRRQAAERVSDLLSQSSEEAQAAVEGFTRQFVLLLSEWDKFHMEYDEWRRTEGGCDRSMAAATLGQFTSDFAAITSAAKLLRQVSVGLDALLVRHEIPAPGS